MKLYQEEFVAKSQGKSTDDVFKKKVRNAFAETIAKTPESWSASTVDMLCQIYCNDDVAAAIKKMGLDGASLSEYLKREDDGVADLSIEIMKHNIPTEEVQIHLK